MASILLFVTLFSQFSPYNLWAASVVGPAEIMAEFSKLNGIQVGAPVLAEGQLVGAVSQIESLQPKTSLTGLERSKDAELGYRVIVKVSPRHRGLLRRGTVALIKSPVSAARIKPEMVVELLIPREGSAPVLGEGEHVAGYSSFEEFWSADFRKRGLPANSFQAS